MFGGGKSFFSPGNKLRPFYVFCLLSSHGMYNIVYLPELFQRIIYI